ncbi:hypothetical protein IHO40_02905 [Wolbachia endosymbiont of Mansonella ozzardi]|uniref:hypothetical protein n=1 Tax=Wolbachia endosymbiont of Mansonella ozzardi TaxID=137464 RepID=UPI001CE22EC4|nr:hypothetical protein [Wolbachia endosymbiont of Mansonella ozzardi]MCA4775057.1 hypothetical protein [Wolbachia endosymbiont of Mansonella ozzardi]
MFGTIDYDMVLIHPNSAVALSSLSVGCTVEAVVGNLRKADKVAHVVLAVGTVAVALYYAYCAIKSMFFSGPSTEFTEARVEGFNSQESPNPADGA